MFDRGSPAPIRVVVVDDDSLTRDLLVRSLAQCPGLEVVGDFACGEWALERIPPLQPHVVLLEITLGEEMSGIQMGLRLRERQQGLGLVLLSSHHKASVLKAVPEQAIAGWSFLCKREVDNLEVLQRAIEGTANGLVVFGPQSVATTHSPVSPLQHLTHRQREILALMAQGYSNEYIAAQLTISLKTVENYINVIYQKLEPSWGDSAVQPRVKAVLTFLEASHSSE